MQPESCAINDEPTWCAGCILCVQFTASLLPPDFRRRFNAREQQAENHQNADPRSNNHKEVLTSIYRLCNSFAVVARSLFLSKSPDFDVGPMGWCTVSDHRMCQNRRGVPGSRRELGTWRRSGSDLPSTARACMPRFSRQRLPRWSSVPLAAAPVGTTAWRRPPATSSRSTEPRSASS
jgi:hypothetical protein